jgi:hypothetical protein
MPKYRILQTAPSEWELHGAIVDGWQLVGLFNTEEAAKVRLAELVAADNWVVPAPTYYDSAGKPETEKL